MKALGRRITHIEHRARIHEVARGPSHLIVMPDSWPAADCLAYDTLFASGDIVAWHELIAKHTGQRPGPTTRVVALRRRDDGPQ